jgi:hypothetical protein
VLSDREPTRMPRRVGGRRGPSPMTPAGQRRPREAPSPVAHRHHPPGEADGTTTGTGTAAAFLIGGAPRSTVPLGRPHQTVRCGWDRAPDGGG